MLTETEKYYTIERLIEENSSYNQEHRVTDEDVKKVNNAIAVIEKQCQSFEPGVIIECVGFSNYRNQRVVHEYGHLETLDYFGEFGCHICTQPYVPFVSINKDKAFMNTSGGYWFTEKDKSQFVYIGRKLKTFCIWGHCGMRGNGAIDFRVTVNVYQYVNNDKIY